MGSNPTSSAIFLAPRRKRSRFWSVHKEVRRWVLSAAVLTAALSAAVALCLIPPGPTVTYHLVGASSNWIVADRRAAATLPQRLRGAPLWLFVSWLQSGTAKTIAEAVTRMHPSSEVDRIADTIAQLQQLVLTADQVPHVSQWRPTVITGFGYCDQVNGAAARVLSRWFPRAQSWAMLDSPSHTSPHTVGRVWSAGFGEWIYFDAFCEPGIVYLHDGHPHPVILRRVPSGQPGRAHPPPGLYDKPGFVLNEYRPSLGGTLIVALERIAAGSTALEDGTMSETSAPPPPVPTSNERSYSPVQASDSPVQASDERLYREISDRYVRARILHLAGKRDEALTEYRRLGADRRAVGDSRTAELAAASRAFAALLERTPPPL